ncbi:MlaE family lipid ABC transporter permease subunit [Cyanobacterium stanieri LEGE 03274]|uniref:MlaE family lipid ABC transporter permease subunit n=1 Tax=Cyanobacterium stanieri LEGE 03274 TaxID=1828756 RepID=A0ABR9V2P8_9CHRO|nr:MlaE family lipid ABC transporter permease subunit [Cyanobacterium stanieri]MBE9221821.1 MlaE family lipid ABC transporter permease subunit [Cyanobacterium stanieri LEGE 03274]
MNKLFQRISSALFLTGQIFIHLLQFKVYRFNTIEQMSFVGPASLPIALITAAFVGMVFTIQVAREFIYFGATSAVGGVLAIALTRELAPVLTAVVLAGRVGSAFAAEIGTMKVTEQIDALQILKTDPVDYLVTPRVISCFLMLPILTISSLVVGVTAGLVIADSVYDIPSRVFLDSIRNFLGTWDVIACIIKSAIFGAVVAIIGCNWGLTTSGGAKGVGQSTTAAVVISLITIFMFNFILSWLMFQGTGSAVIS